MGLVSRLLVGWPAAALHWMGDLKDALHTVEAIQAICKRYGAEARVFEAGTGRVVGDITRAGDRVKGWGE